MRRCDFGFNATQTAGRIDQVLIELAPVNADLFDLTLKRYFGLGRLALLIAGGFELLVMLLERVELFCLVVLRWAALALSLLWGA